MRRGLRDGSGTLEEGSGKIRGPSLARGGAGGGALVRGHGRERVRDELLLGDNRRVGRGLLRVLLDFLRVLFVVVVVVVAVDVGFDVSLFQDDVAVHDRLDGAAGLGRRRRVGEGLDAERLLVHSLLLGDDLLRHEPVLDHALLGGDRSLRRSLRRLHGFGLDGLGRRGPPRRVRDELLEAVLAFGEFVAHGEKVGQRRVVVDRRRRDVNRRGSSWIRTVARLCLLPADPHADLLLPFGALPHLRRELLVLPLLVDEVRLTLGEPILKRRVLFAVHPPPVLVRRVVLPSGLRAVHPAVRRERLDAAGVVEGDGDLVVFIVRRERVVTPRARFAHSRRLGRGRAILLGLWRVGLGVDARGKEQAAARVDLRGRVAALVRFARVLELSKPALVKITHANSHIFLCNTGILIFFQITLR
mmetsp:Transcript_11307/g.51212  ORF Transcript_11307/g.51212 Transcript_11307/m.51212 type:complete len:416 (-) Transcript_11307:41-1288(-)